MRWSWSLDAWRILINPIRSWSPWSRRILDPLIFRNKPSLNKNRILFILHQKRKPEPEKETDSALENTSISQLILMISRLIPAISRLINYIVDYCIMLPLCFCFCFYSVDYIVGVLCVSRLIHLISRLISTIWFASACFKSSSSPTRLDLLRLSSPLENNINV